MFEMHFLFIKYIFAVLYLLKIMWVKLAVKELSKSLVLEINLERIKRYKRVGYNIDIMRQSTGLVVNQITVYSYGFLFNCTTVGQASDSMRALT